MKEVRAADGTLKGWYCDITRPAAVTAGEVVVEDLDLDLWVSADRSLVLRLDEDEFEASGLADRDPQAAARARRRWTRWKGRPAAAATCGRGPAAPAGAGPGMPAVGSPGSRRGSRTARHEADRGDGRHRCAGRTAPAPRAASRAGS